MSQGASKPGAPLLHQLTPLHCLLLVVGSPAPRDKYVPWLAGPSERSHQEGCWISSLPGNEDFPFVSELGPAVSPGRRWPPPATPSFGRGFCESSLRNHKWQPSPDNPPRMTEWPFFLPLCRHVLLWPAAEDTGPRLSRLMWLEGGQTPAPSL